MKMRKPSIRQTVVALAFAVFGVSHASAAPCLCDCSGNYDQSVGVDDLLALIGQWGTPGSCDFDGDGIGVTDLLELLHSMGSELE